MGHDILGFNKAGEEIAYARFSMGNPNSTILYNLLNALDYYAGVSGSGDSINISTQQIEEALEAFKQICNYNDNSSKSEFENWDAKQISNFLLNCLETARKEENVRVYFG
ncbi:hypothetical protein SAMN05880501_10244 [Ureibacillus xyleni]|uniref:Uncharacterized protein n=1 Tax=Ureibacillus xyleni TaxID=614648 RepID=A0A285S0H6_9BACL|nr:hypothetical protein [Ureibacillus xyleni]SOB98549.1 hypothetical protein SAMN05880501_10244 [Ureibacillus xyleni]